MKKLSLITLLVGSSLLGGCARPGEFLWTPAYTSKERGNMILRNWDYEGKQTQDDIDTALLLRPVSTLTIWNVR